MTDHEIIELIRDPAGKEKGFRHLVIKYQERLYHVIRRQTASHEDADDILQNTFLKIFRHLPKFEGRSELFTWMYRIATHEVINYKKQNQKSLTSELNQFPDEIADAYMDSDQLSASLEKYVAVLPERQQMVFRMRYYDELSYKEIASILDLTEGALKASFHHAVKKIEQEFRAKQIL